MDINQICFSNLHSWVCRCLWPLPPLILCLFSDPVRRTNKLGQTWFYKFLRPYLNRMISPFMVIMGQCPAGFLNSCSFTNYWAGWESQQTITSPQKTIKPSLREIFTCIWINKLTCIWSQNNAKREQFEVELVQPLGKIEHLLQREHRKGYFSNSSFPTPKKIQCETQENCKVYSLLWLAEKYYATNLVFRIQPSPGIEIKSSLVEALIQVNCWKKCNYKAPFWNYIIWEKRRKT